MPEQFCLDEILLHVPLVLRWLAYEELMRFFNGNIW